MTIEAEKDPVKNPKHATGLAKPGFRRIPPVALLEEGKVMALGADKYGPFNWGEAGVVATIYYDAILRHLFAFYTGEDRDQESGCLHLAHIRACCAILMDCQTMGKLEDDRPTGKTSPMPSIMPITFRVPPITKEIVEMLETMKSVATPPINGFWVRTSDGAFRAAEDADISPTANMKPGAQL